MPKSPNVVLVLTDDQGYPPLGCHGHPFIRTPHLDRFHAESVSFDQFHTGTTCAPTRAGIMTGHYCNSTGVWHTIGGRSLLRRDEWSLATALRENGYRTGMFGKWHLGDEYPYRPEDRGFDTVVRHGGGGVSQQPDWWGNDYFDDTYWKNGTPTAFEGYCTDVFFDQALAFIEANRDRPFFCYISTNAPHGPFNVEPVYRDLYADEAGSEQYARFLGMVTNIDDNFGRLRARLAELGLEDDTILIFMSDNGQTGVDPAVNGAMFNAGMRGLKGSPYEGGHRVPFFVRWPGGGLQTARRVDDLAAYIDIMPTLLDLCGIAPPAQRVFHGRSLVPLLRGESGGPWSDRAIVTDTQRVAHPLKWRMSCVMRGPWRLVNRNELYDLRVDPGQRTNVIADHSELAAELREAYEHWWGLCSRQMDDDIPFSVGADGQEETVLRSHDLRNEQDHAVVWNQAQVRGGETCHGYWEVFVERSGTYRFELRRWPREAGHTVTGGIEGDDVVYRADGIAPGAEAHYRGGRALPFDTAYLEMDGLPQQCTAVNPGDAAAVFTVELKRGPRHVRARFAGNSGLYGSAYYVYVRRLAGGP
ncbi:MAG: arylsulfatase [Kiritimatiellaeota bacterium]|nr:arylsulfatase [Kiritimatiellota bacterium]